MSDRQVSRWLLLAVLLAGPPAAAGEDVAERAPAEPRESVLLVLSRARDVPADDAAARSRAVHELAFASQWPDLVSAYAATEPDARDAPRRDVLLDALAVAGEAKVGEMLAVAAGSDASPTLRTVALAVAARPAAPVRLDAVLAVVLCVPAAQRGSPHVRDALRDAVAAIVDRRPAEVETLRRHWPSLDRELRTAALDGIARTGPGAGTRAMCRLLGTGSPDEGEVLAQIARAPFLESEPVGADARAALARAFVSEDPGTRRGAARLAGRLGGPELAEALVALLDDGDRRVAAAAHQGLESAVGTHLIADREMWRARLAAEAEWAQARLPADLETLRTPNAPAAVAALRRIAAHPLHGDATVRAAAAALDRTEASVRAAACETLARLGRPAAIPDLLRTAEDPDPGVAASASAALAAVTRLPQRGPAAWRRALVRGAH
jgi:HEAT repeat protein